MSSFKQIPWCLVRIWYLLLNALPFPKKRKKNSTNAFKSDIPVDANISCSLAFWFQALLVSVYMCVYCKGLLVSIVHLARLPIRSSVIPTYGKNPYLHIRFSNTQVVGFVNLLLISHHQHFFSFALCVWLWIGHLRNQIYDNYWFSTNTFLFTFIVQIVCEKFRCSVFLYVCVCSGFRSSLTAWHFCPANRFFVRNMRNKTLVFVQHDKVSNSSSMENLIPWSIELLLLLMLLMLMLLSLSL